MKWVTIQTFAYAHEAHLSKLLLENNGVESFINGENTAQTFSFQNQLFGGVQLQVLTEDVLKAKTILNLHDYNKPKESSNKTVVWLQAFSERLPFLRNKSLEIKLFVSLLIVITLIVLCLSVIYVIIESL